MTDVRSTGRHRRLLALLFGVSLWTCLIRSSSGRESTVDSVKTAAQNVKRRALGYSAAAALMPEASGLQTARQHSARCGARQGISFATAVDGRFSMPSTHTAQRAAHIVVNAGAKQHPRAKQENAQLEYAESAVSQPSVNRAVVLSISSSTSCAKAEEIRNCGAASGRNSKRRTSSATTPVLRSHQEAAIAHWTTRFRGPAAGHSPSIIVHGVTDALTLSRETVPLKSSSKCVEWWWRNSVSTAFRERLVVDEARASDRATQERLLIGRRVETVPEAAEHTYIVASLELSAIRKRRSFLPALNGGVSALEIR